MPTTVADVIVEVLRKNPSFYPRLSETLRAVAQVNMIREQGVCIDPATLKIRPYAGASDTFEKLVLMEGVE